LVGNALMRMAEIIAIVMKATGLRGSARGQQRKGRR